MKNLLYIIGVKPKRIGGIEIFVRELADQLQPLGYRLIVAFESLPEDSAVASYLDLPNLTIIALPAQSRIDMTLLFRSAKSIFAFRPSILVYAFNGPLKPYPILAKLAGANRIIFNDHSSRMRGEKPVKASLLKRSLALFLTAPVNTAICVCEFVRSFVVAQGLVERSKAQVVLNGVDVAANRATPAQRTQFRERYKIPHDATVVLQVSWMIPEKGVDRLLKAAKLVLGRAPTTVFMLVGEGAQMAELKKMSVDFGIASNIVFTGQVRYPTSEGAFAAADIYCQMSQWQEACPLSVLEAMSFGLPVVATRVGGIPELVDENRTGFLVQQDDIEAMASRLAELVIDPRLRNSMGAEGRRRTEAMFDVRKTVGQYIQLFDLAQ